MARIRSLKPEAFSSESLAKVSVNAERTFYGMSTIADDRGRLADKPAQINGELWAMRGGHTPAELEEELEQLVKADDLVCRYTGCDGKRYLHLPTWDLHQKIDRPGKPRAPRCPHHLVSPTGVEEECPKHAGDCPPQECSQLDLFSMGTREGSSTSPPHDDASSRDSDAGSRTMDLGSRIVPPSAAAPQAPPKRGKPAKHAVADALAAEFWDRHKTATAQSFLAIRNVIRTAIGNGLARDKVADALERLASEGTAISGGAITNALKPPRSGKGARASPHQPYRNPDQSAYDEEAWPA